MKTAIFSGVAALLAALPMVAGAADFDGSKRFICASVSVSECVPGEGCRTVSADAVNAPRFLNVDVKNKKLSARFAEGERSSDIERTETVDGKLMLQGVEDGREQERDGIGWTLAVSEAHGDMVLTGSGEAVAFVIFGACTLP